VSGVYTLLTRGSLAPDHPDHPASRRRPGESGNRDFRGVELTTEGISLASAYSLANGRWGNRLSIAECCGGPFGGLGRLNWGGTDAEARTRASHGVRIPSFVQN
jgi:hypothetical protein